jgi:hypothetical protein
MSFSSVYGILITRGHIGCQTPNPGDKYELCQTFTFPQRSSESGIAGSINPVDGDQSLKA